MITENLANAIRELSDEARYFEVLAFIANAQEAAIEARSCLTKEQSWDLFTAIQDYKRIVEEMANQRTRTLPNCIGIK